MADTKISDLNELAATPAADDWVAIVDTDAVETKKIAPANLHGGYVTDGELTTHEADTSTHGAADIADVSDIAVDANLSANAQNAVTNRHAEAHTVVSHSDTTGTGAELNTLTGGGDADALHGHATLVGTHALLDGDVHTDTAVDAPTQGSIIAANSTPAWDELVIGAAGTVLTSDAADPSWQAPATPTNVIIDSTPADVSAEGIKSALTAGEAIDVPEVCYMNADGEIYLADADAPGATPVTTSPAICMALESKTDGQACSVLMIGFVFCYFVPSWQSRPAPAAGESPGATKEKKLVGEAN